MVKILLNLDEAKEIVNELSDLSTLHKQLNFLLDHASSLQLNIDNDGEHTSFNDNVVIDGTEDEVISLEEKLTSIQLNCSYLRSGEGVISLLNYIGIKAEGV